MFDRYTGMTPSAVQQGRQIGQEARERVIQAVLQGSPLSTAWMQEVDRCNAAWSDLDPDTREIAMEQAKNLHQIEHDIEARRTERRAQLGPWWRIW